MLSIKDVPIQPPPLVTVHGFETESELVRVLTTLPELTGDTLPATVLTGDDYLGGIVFQSRIAGPSDIANDIRVRL